MAQVPPKKPVKPGRQAPPSNYHQVPLDESTAGQRFRVRCKDWDAVWGQDLSYEEAVKLKELVVTRGKSRTARIENMTIPPPDWYTSQMGGHVPPPAPRVQPVDPQLEALRAPALATSRASAAEAAKRHKLAAARDRSSTGTAKVKMMVPVISTEIPPLDEISDDIQGDIDDVDLHDLMAGGDQPSDAELAAAKSARDKDDAAITAKAKQMYNDRWAGEVHAPWDTLPKQTQAGWRFDAAAAISAGPSMGPDKENPDQADAPA